jgi:hypothetical protein
LITEIENQISKRDGNDGASKFLQSEMLWIEGESNDAACPVRDGEALSDPLGSGSLLGDINNIVGTFQGNDEEDKAFSFSKLGNMAEKVTGRLQKLNVEDVASIVGIDKKFTQREMKFLQSIFSGEGLAHHMEDKYYQGMGMCCGYAALAGQELRPLAELEAMDVAEIEEAINESESSMSYEEQYKVWTENASQV